MKCGEILSSVYVYTIHARVCVCVCNEKETWNKDYLEESIPNMNTNHYCILGFEILISFFIVLSSKSEHDL
jgi:hypothetical protein